MADLHARVDERAFELLKGVADAARALGIQWMVTGASGRVLLLENVYGLPRGRATRDVDFGVMVSSWREYRRLRSSICADPRFTEDSRQRQRIRHATAGYVDLVPFGGLEAPGHVIEWPPDREFQMTVTGFHDAWRDAVEVRVNGKFTGRVVSPAGLMLLKLVAWRERHLAYPGRDAADIGYLLQHFGKVLTLETLFEQHFEAAESVDFDLDLANARILGEKVRAIASPETRAVLARLLAGQLTSGTESRLVREIAPMRLVGGDQRAYQLVQQLALGIGR